MMMGSTRISWTEDETKLALYLYFQLSFGQLHSGNPEVQKLAKVIGRTDSSVAMKLCNFASLDPKITESGRKGLRGASAQDRRIWSYFNEDWTSQVQAMEKIWNAAEADPEVDLRSVKEDVAKFEFEPYSGPSVVFSTTEQRVGQQFFRRAVFANFENTCCITGIAEPTLLNASHIMPWAIDVKNRHNPANGLCLSATFDRAFDRGLIAISRSGAVLIAGSLMNHSNLQTKEYFAHYEGALIKPSTRFDPEPRFLDWHRSSVFVDAS